MTMLPAGFDLSRNWAWSVAWLLAAGLLLACALPVRAQDRADQVDYLGRDKTAKPIRVTGAIKSETPAKVVVVSAFNMRPVEIPAVDIIDVRYDKEPEEVNQARAGERSRRFEDALAACRLALKKVPPGQRGMQAAIEFRHARLTALVAEEKPAGRVLAIEELRRFRRNQPEARQSLECLELLSRLLILEGQSPQEALEGFRALKRQYGGDSKELALRCDQAEGGLLVEEARNLLKDQPDQARMRYGAAQKKLQELLPSLQGPALLDAKIAMAECKAAQGDQAAALRDLEGYLAEAADDRTRAAVHLGRGDCFRLAQQPREAMWEYLWVDVIYNQDRDQHARALFHLVEVFDALKDGRRGRDCRERLQKEFGDTRYARMVSAKS